MEIFFFFLKHYVYPDTDNQPMPPADVDEIQVFRSDLNLNKHFYEML